MVTGHKNYCEGTYKRRAVAFAASVLTAVLSLSYLDAEAAAPQQPNESLTNSGFVLVAGYGYQGANMLFCEPKAGHIEIASVYYAPVLEVKDGKCLEPIVGATREHRALSAQQYLDELIGPDQVEPTSIAPMPSTYGKVISVIYYRPIKRNIQ